MPSVSIIITTHERPKLLRRAVASAIAAGQDVEVIVVDDASTDETSELCRTLDKIKYIRVERNQGVAGARNLGILASSADYVAFLDDDDLRLPGSLDRQVRALEMEPSAGFICGAMIMADQKYSPTGEVSTPPRISGDHFWNILALNFPVMPLAVVIRKKCLFSTGLFRRRLAGIDDWDMFVRLAELYPVLISQEPVGIYRQPTSGSGQGSSIRSAQLSRVASQQLRLLSLPRAARAPRRTRRLARRGAMDRIGDTLLQRAAQAFAYREYGEGLHNFSSAMRLRPRRAFRVRAYSKLWSRWIANRG